MAIKNLKHFVLIASAVASISAGNFAPAKTDNITKLGSQTTPRYYPGRPVACPDIYKPVCGANGKTYGNECFAKGAKAPVAHNGPCR